MINKGNDPQFRLVNYYNLPRYIYIYCIDNIDFSNDVPCRMEYGPGPRRDTSQTLLNRFPKLQLDKARDCLELCQPKKCKNVVPKLARLAY